MASQLPLDRTDPGTAIAEFEQVLASNSGEDPFETAIRLLACKLIDELESDPRKRLFKQHASAAGTYAAVEKLYLRARKAWNWLNGTELSLGISPEHLSRTIGPLVGWNLRGSDLSILDAALERLVARNSKGQLGQYFTPRQVVRLCVEVLNPRPGDLVLDPACGSGGFLFEAARYSLSRYGEAPISLGVDFSNRSARVAALMAAADPGLGIQVSRGNSLDARDHEPTIPDSWRPFLSRSATKPKTATEAWSTLECDLLLTNPPFAGDIDDIELLSRYSSVPGRGARPRASREHLFLERAINVLSPGGRLAIVLPQGLLANSTASNLRTWVLERCRLLGVIGMHPHAFLPYTSVKTSLVFLEKYAPGAPREPYDCFFSTSTSPGKDSSGRNVGSGDYEALATSFKDFLAEQKLPWVVHVARGQRPASSVSIEEVRAASRIDAEYFDPHKRSVSHRLRKTTDKTIGSHVTTNIDRFQRKLGGTVLYIDISSVDENSGDIRAETIDAASAPSRATYLVRPGDVLVSTVRPERNVVGLVHGASHHPRVASNGFCVLRPIDIAPELLFAYCKTEAFKTVLTRHATASMYPTVAEKDIYGMPLVLPAVTEQRRIVDLVNSAFRKSMEAMAQIGTAVSTFDALVAGTYAKTAKVSEKRRRYGSPRARR